MSGDDQDKKFDPTPRRIEEFRKRGQIALSRDLSTIGALIGGSAASLASMSSMHLAVSEHLTRSLTFADAPAQAMMLSAVTFLQVFAPAAIGAMAGWLVTSAVQIGAPPAFAPLKFDLTKIASPQALGEVFSPKKQAMRALKAVAKLLVVGAAAVAALNAEWAHFQAEPALDAGAIFARSVSAITRVTTWSGAALLLLAIGDFALAKRRLTNEMKMSLEEMKKEMKENDGDPHIKRRRKQRMRELSKKRFVAAVKSSDVILVNPTEYAVALRYRSKKDPAPRVVAKGKDKVAERIRTLARENGVPIVVNIPLARLLHKIVPEGKVIPSHVFRAVAEVLGYVYRLRGRRAR